MFLSYKVKKHIKIVAIISILDLKKELLFYTYQGQIYPLVILLFRIKNKEVSHIVLVHQGVQLFDK